MAAKHTIYNLHVEYCLPEDEHKMFETCRWQKELNQNINLNSAFCWLTLHNCITMRGTKQHNSIMQPSVSLYSAHLRYVTNAYHVSVKKQLTLFSRIASELYLCSPSQTVFPFQMFPLGTQRCVASNMGCADLIQTILKASRCVWKSISITQTYVSTIYLF